MLIDDFGRKVTYLRLSVTDRCDLRCIYCMSENMTFVPRSQLLTLEELARVGRAFIGLGVKKIRITGGEPLTRRNILSLFQALGEEPGLEELTLTTNGTLLPRYARQLRTAGVRRVNISLDTLDEERFRRFTRTGELARTLAGIDAALEAGFERVKINAVVLEGHNQDEVVRLVAFALERGMDISFIEEMPLGIMESRDREAHYCSSDRILEELQRHYTLIPTTENTGGPARYHRIAGSDTRVGFISPHSHNFCDSCNRVRLTAEGRLLLCLGQEHSMDLRRVLRANPADDEPLRRAIVAAMRLKPRGHEFDLSAPTVLLRHMNATGG